MMACCLMSPSHYLNQFWFITNGVLWHSTEINLAASAQDIDPWNGFENLTSKITATLPRGQWVKGIHTTNWRTLMAIQVIKTININVVHKIKLNQKMPRWHWAVRAGQFNTKNKTWNNLSQLITAQIYIWPLFSRTRQQCQIRAAWSPIMAELYMFITKPN